MGKVVIVEPMKCTGCLSCMITCSSINEGIGDLNISRIKVTPFRDEGFFVPGVCQQCEIPYCALVCPVNALTKDSETRVVKVEKNKCIGCKMCLMGCPFGSMTFVGSTSAKCNTCGGNPACVKVCRWGALEYGEADEIGSAKRLYLAKMTLSFKSVVEEDPSFFSFQIAKFRE